MIATGGYMGAVELSEHIAHVHDEAPGRPFGREHPLTERRSRRGSVRKPRTRPGTTRLCFTEKVPVIVTGLGDPSAILTKLTQRGAMSSPSSVARGRHARCERRRRRRHHPRK